MDGYLDMEAAINEITEMSGLCNLCADLKADAQAAPTAEDGIQVILDYDGFQCGTVQIMKMIAWRAKDGKRRDVKNDE